MPSVNPKPWRPSLTKHWGSASTRLIGKDPDPGLANLNTTSSVWSPRREFSGEGNTALKEHSKQVSSARTRLPFTGSFLFSLRDHSVTARSTSPTPDRFTAVDDLIFPYFRCGFSSCSEGVTVFYSEFSKTPY